MNSTRPIFEFGGFTLDRARRTLRDADGRPVTVTAKAFDALVYLVEHRGELVERSALLDALWPNTVVEGNNLNQAVAALRRTLGDGFIATITGRGYQFVADVREIRYSTDQPAAPPRRPGTRRVRRNWAASSIVVALIAAGYVYVAPDRTVRPRVDVQAALDLPGGKPAAPNSLAVLPFVDLSADRDQSYFAEGLAEELINRLSRIEPLQVTPRTSSFVFRGSTVGVAEIAAALGVTHVLEGSVAKDGESLRVRVQLVDAAVHHNVWSESFDRRIDDVFPIQEEIAAAVAEALRGPLGVDERVSASGSTSNLDAYELYLAAKSNQVFMRDRVSRGLDQIDRSLELDPNFALAWAQKSRLLNQLHVLILEPRGGETQIAAEQAARRALELSPELGTAHAALAAALFAKGDRVGAEREYRRAFALGDRGDLEVYGLLLLSVGHLERARQYLMAARERDPFNANASAWLAAAHDSLGDTQAALAEYRRGRRLFDPWIEGAGNEIITRLGMADTSYVRALPDLYPDTVEWAHYGRVLRDADQQARALTEVRAVYPNSPDRAYLLVAAARFGDPEFALDELSALFRDRPGSATHVLWRPVFKDMRRLPAFKHLAREEGLVDYWLEFGWTELCRPVAEADFECS